MFPETPAQGLSDATSEESGSVPTEADTSDTALLEEALQAAVDAHAAGLLAAPFGVDEIALKRARRRALRSDLRRLLADGQADHNDAT
jgi:hypothetical protein